MGSPRRSRGCTVCSCRIALASTGSLNLSLVGARSHELASRLQELRGSTGERGESIPELLHQLGELQPRRDAKARKPAAVQVDAAALAAELREGVGEQVRQDALAALQEGLDVEAIREQVRGVVDERATQAALAQLLALPVQARYIRRRVAVVGARRRRVAWALRPRCGRPRWRCGRGFFCGIFCELLRGRRHVLAQGRGRASPVAQEAVLSKVYAVDSDFSGVDFTSAVIDRAALMGSKFVGANFYNAVFTGVGVEGSDFTDARFEDALIGSQDAKFLCENPTVKGDARLDIGCRN